MEKPAKHSGTGTSQPWEEPPPLDEIDELTQFRFLRQNNTVPHAVENPGGQPEPARASASQLQENNITPKSPVQLGQCVKCRTVNPGDNRFCSECGALLYEVCPACKVENRVGTKFCGKCGLDVARHKRIVCLRQQATELKQRAGQVPGQTVQLLTEARQKLQGILTESPTDETAQNELDQLNENLCAAFLKLASAKTGDEALASYKRMLLVFPKHPEATAEVARLEQILKSAIANVKALIEAGNFSEAAKQAVQANNTSGPWAELQALQHRAEIGASLLDQIRTQRSGAALFACRKLLQAFPDNKAAHIRLQEIEQRLQELKSSAGESIEAGDYKQAMLDLDKTLADFGSESELQDIASKNVLRELATLREQAKSYQARVIELSDELIPSLIQERKYVAVLGCLDELIELGAGAEFVTETGAKATEEVQAAQAFAERGEQLLAARKPRKAIKEFNHALERCADNQRAIEGREGAGNSLAFFSVVFSVVGIIAVVMLVMFGVSLVSAWQDRSAWAEAQQTVKIAGNDLEHIKQGYQKYLAAFPNGNHVSAAQQALAHIQEVEQARELAERERQSQIYYESGISKQSKGDLAGALADYNRAIEQTPGVANLYSQRGKLKKAQGDLAGALADYNQAITLKPDNADDYYNRGTLAQVTGNMDSGIGDFTKVIELKPDFADAYNNRGIAKNAEGDADGAMADYSKAIELEPAFADAYNNRGIAKNAKGDADGALVDCNKALELKPVFADAYNNRGIAKNAKGDLDGAMADYDKAIEINPQFADAYFDRGLVGEAKGNLDGAMADYNRVVEWNPKLANQNLLDRLVKEKAYPTMDGVYENSLGMKFAPVTGTAVLFGVWDVRVVDYRAYASASSRVDGSWKNPGFETHPVVNVRWNEVKAFCAWLTEKERREGKISESQSYRLPSDGEWSVAVGLNESSGGTPASKSMAIKGVYPWGTSWPPPSGAGNYDQSLGVDNYAQTSPVGSFAANRFGLYDMGGNVWQCCEDWYDGSQQYRVLRGASWNLSNPDYLLSSFRYRDAPDYRYSNVGFRVVLASDSSPKLVEEKQRQLAQQEKARLARMEQGRQAYNEGVTNEARGDLEGAMALYNRAVELNPKLANQDLLDRLKVEIEQKKIVGEKQRQLAQQDKARLARMEQGRQAYNEGVTNEARGDLEGAMADYNKAIELNSGIAMAYYKRANAKAGNKDFLGSIEDYDKFIEINPNEAPAYINRSKVKEAKDDLEGALADYNKAVELDSKLADHKWQQKLTDEISQQNAIANIAKAIDTATNYSEVNLQKNKLINYWLGGELASAVTEAATLANENSKSKDAIIWWLERGAVLRATGLYADSNDAFDRAQLKIDANIRAMPNQANLDYEGRSYDGIMLNTYKALNYLALGLPDNARPELIRAYQRQQDAVDANKRRIEKTQEETAKSKDKAGINDLKVYADYVNPFTVYLDGLFFMVNALDATDLERAHRSFERVASFAGDNNYVKQDLATVDELIQAKPMAPTTYVIFETGCAPVREQIRIDIPINVSKVSEASAAFPTLKLQDNFTRSLTVTADGINATTALVANMDDIITRNYKDNLPVTISKTVNDAALGRPVNIADADTRTWATLPKEFQVARIPTPANRRILLTTPDGIKTYVTIVTGTVNAVYVKSLKTGTPLLVSQFKLRH
jgi:tetratricopeptide (TPR) repeat protein